MVLYDGLLYISRVYNTGYLLSKGGSAFSEFINVRANKNDDRAVVYVWYSILLQTMQGASYRASLTGPLPIDLELVDHPFAR